MSRADFFIIHVEDAFPRNRVLYLAKKMNRYSYTQLNNKIDFMFKLTDFFFEGNILKISNMESNLT